MTNEVHRRRGLKGGEKRKGKKNERAKSKVIKCRPSVMPTREAGGRLRRVDSRKRRQLSFLQRISTLLVRCELCIVCYLTFPSLSLSTIFFRNASEENAQRKDLIFLFDPFDAFLAVRQVLKTRGSPSTHRYVNLWKTAWTPPRASACCLRCTLN